MADKLSLLWLNEEQKGSVFSDFDFITELGIEDFINMNKGNRFRKTSLNIRNFFTDDTAVILYREELFAELLANNELYRMISELIPKVETLKEVNQLQDEFSGKENNLYALKEIDVFVECIDYLYEKLKESSLTSKALSKLREHILYIYDSDEYTHLKEELPKLSAKIRNIKSVTISINLDAQLQPTEAGIVAVNDKYYKSGSLIDRILRADLSDDGFSCLSPLIPFTGNNNALENAAVNRSLLAGLDKIFSNAVRSFKPLVKRYVSFKSNFLFYLLDELRFIKAAMDSLLELKELRLPLCIPILTDQPESIHDLYNPLAAVKIIRQLQHIVIKNDLCFDEDGRLYILTGPNQGGKSVFTYGVGIAYTLLHLGLPIPAESANMRLVSGIHTHFPKKDENSIGKGRLGEECEHISQLCRLLNDKSLVLFDEALSSTGGDEATWIAKEILTAIGIIGVKGIFSTHLHELTRMIDQINEEPRIKSKADNLAATIDVSSNTRSFSIQRQMPDGLSYAKDIAGKYGLNVEEILKNTSGLH